MSDFSGISRSGSFEEALNDALLKVKDYHKNLPGVDQLTIAKVADITFQLGGLAGLEQLEVTVELTDQEESNKHQEVFLMEQVCRSVEVGRHGEIPEVKVEWVRGWPVTYTRTSSIVVDVELCGPDDLMNSVWNDIVHCALLAGAAAGITAIVASPAAALPVFKATFYACLTAKIADRAQEIKVGISVQQKPNGPWRRL